MTILPTAPKFVEYYDNIKTLENDILRVSNNIKELVDRKVDLIKHMEVLTKLASEEKEKELALCAVIGKGLIKNIDGQYCLYDLDYDNPTDYSNFNLKKEGV